MEDKSKENAKITLFCYYAATLQNGREAAVRAGYPPEEAEEWAARLVMRRKVRQRIRNLGKEEELLETGRSALQGLRRLAFGPVNDALALLGQGEPGPETVQELDLFHISEVKYPKGGGLEIKFFSRLDALKLLLDYAQRGEKDAPDPAAASIYQALDRAAASLEGGNRDAV